MAIFDRKFYDVIVHPTAGQGDYTSIATALSTEGANKSIFVKRGTYTETVDVLPLAGQSIYFDEVTITFNDAYLYINNKSHVYMAGKLIIAGYDTTNTYNSLWASSGTYLNTSALDVTITPTAITSGEAIRVVDFSQTYSHIGTMRLVSFAGTVTTNTKFIYGFISAAASYNYYENLEVTNMTVAGQSTGWGVGIAINENYSLVNARVQTLTASTNSPVYGVITNTFQSCFNVIINAVTSSAANTGTGFRFVSGGGANYNSVQGSSRGCDLANFTDSGTGNKSANLAV